MGEHELDGMKEQLEEEISAREDINRQTSKAEAEASMWHSKYETDAVAKAEELEMSKMKLQARLTEAESTIENLNGKLQQCERAKGKIHAEIEEMNINLDQAQILNNQMEKKARHFDKIVIEWKRKVDGLAMDLDVAQKECRNASSELFRVKAAYEEAEGALEQEENKVLRAQLELTQVRQEIERRIGEKDEEFMGVKKNMSKAIEGMQSALEQESRGKAEAL